MTVLRLTILGTSAAQPTERRGLSATAVRAHGDRFLIDCGEGTQRQLLRFGVGYRLDYVLFTHFHADHYLGIIGFLRTLSMGGREEPLTLYGPGPHVDTLLKRVVNIGIEGLSFPIEFAALAPGDVIERGDYRVRAVGVDHRIVGLGFSIEEPSRPGVFDVARARELGVPPGPLYGRLQAGEAVTLDDGREILPQAVLGPARSGRKVVLSGDTRPCDALAEAAQDADVLIHEATFGEAEQERAQETRHSTAREAAQIARRSGAKQLVLTHLSARYDTIPERLSREAQKACDCPVSVAEDGWSAEVPLAD